MSDRGIRRREISRIREVVSRGIEGDASNTEVLQAAKRGGHARGYDRSEAGRMHGESETLGSENSRNASPRDECQ